MTRHGATGRDGAAIAIANAALLLCTANLAFAWPGLLTPDSQSQLQQAISGQFNDWHPPFMAMLWQLIGATIPAMLVVQVALHWAGIWTFAEGARRTRHSLWPWVLLALGLTPIAFKYTGIIQKDSLLTSFLVLAFGLAFLLPQRAFGWPFGIAAALCRANGSFALPPLLLERMHRRVGLLGTVAASLAMAVVMVPAIGVFNTHVLGARETGVQRSVQLFDMAGIAHVSHDDTVLPAGATDAARCYTPLFWDALDRCMAPLSAIKPSLTQEWVTAIAKHPLAYAQHRIAHFNRAIFFIVPPIQQCVDAPAYHTCDFSRHGLIRDTVQKNALLWPVTWLVIGLALLAAPLERTARALVASALLYGFAYAIVGVASDFRYFYWTELAIQLAILVQMATVGRIGNWRTVAATIGVVWMLGYGARWLLA